MAHRLLRWRKNLDSGFTGLSRSIETSFGTGKASNCLIKQAFHTETVQSKVVREKAWSRQLREWSKVAQQLSKARLSAFVASTAAVGFVAGSGDVLDWNKLGWTTIGTFAASACANTLNQIYEIRSDGKMRRTMMRPLPTGKVTRLQALAFAGIMGLSGISILTIQANGMTAGLGAGNIALYAGVYTPLKAVTFLNTWVGAVVGAIPPLMGWAAASGTLEPGAGILAAALYFWQMPHFLALAWLHREDYMRGGYAMLSRWDPRGSRTASAALRNSLYMLPIGAAATWVGTTTVAFAYEATIAAGTLATTSAVFYGTPSKRSARLLFRFSLLFLPVFMLGMLVHRVPNDHSVTFQGLKAKFMQDLSPSEGADLQHESKSSEIRMLWPVREFSVAPGPLLPVPLRLRCPAKVDCEGKTEGERTLQ